MSILGDYVSRVLYCALLCSMLLMVFPEKKTKAWLRMVSGVFLIVITLSYSGDFQLPKYKGISSEYLNQAKAISSAGEVYAIEQQQEYIMQALEAYILDKAGELGLDIRVHVALDMDGYPISVHFEGDVESVDQEKIENVVLKDLGIAKEDQHWNGLQMQKHSAVP